MTVAQILEMLRALDRAFGLAGDLVALAKQNHPELREDPLPALDEVDDARADALARTRGGK